MRDLLGMSVPLFIGLTLCLFGLAAWLMGQALANTWRPVWQNVVYALLLGVGNRFLVYVLFGGPPLSVSGYVINTAVLIGIALLAYRLTRAHKMVTQYPWLYEKTGPLAWRAKR